MAAALLSEDQLTQISTHAAENFVKAYYNALDNKRDTIAQHYMPLTPLPTTGSFLPRITYNGEQITDPSILEARYKDLPRTRTECQSLNVHVMNPAIMPLDANARTEDKRNNISCLVQVSGSFKMVDSSESPRGFSDSIVLVPNNTELGGKGKGRAGEGKSWIIQSQNYRIVT